MLTITDAVAQGGGNSDDAFPESSRGRLTSGRPSASKGKVDAYEDDDDDGGGYEGEGVVADDEYD